MRQLRGTELKRFLRGYRKAHPTERQITLLLQSVEYPVNVGSIFRIANACNVEEVILTGISPTPPHPTISRVARSKDKRVRWRYVKSPQEVIASLKEEVILTGISPTPPHPTISRVARSKDKRVRWRYVKSPQEVIASLKGEGYAICALEITDQSVPYYAFDYPAKVCLVVGHQDHGVTRQTLALCDAAVFVPMYGKGRSLNVHVCLGVVCYHILHSGVPEGGRDER